jgi:hypothetical protein
MWEGRGPKKSGYLIADCGWCKTDHLVEYATNGTHCTKWRNHCCGDTETCPAARKNRNQALAQMTQRKPFKCRSCERHFTDKGSRWQHAEVKHLQPARDGDLRTETPEERPSFKSVLTAALCMAHTPLKQRPKVTAPKSEVLSIQSRMTILQLALAKPTTEENTEPCPPEMVKLLHAHKSVFANRTDPMSVKPVRIPMQTTPT